ncbi:methylenetetrahydrofolate reductase [Sesbania bispinosa]|nr:methylenetetrahydrofolate reductase [Sesbania bispinosa]
MGSSSSFENKNQKIEKKFLSLFNHSQPFSFSFFDPEQQKTSFFFDLSKRCINEALAGTGAGFLNQWVQGSTSSAPSGSTAEIAQRFLLGLKSSYTKCETMRRSIAWMTLSRGANNVVGAEDLGGVDGFLAIQNFLLSFAHRVSAKVEAILARLTFFV